MSKAHREKAARKQERERENKERKQRETESDARESAQYSEALKAFNEAFPTEAQRKKQIDDFYSRFPIYPPGSYGLKSAAIQEWHSAQKNNPNKN